MLNKVFFQKFFKPTVLLVILFIFFAFFLFIFQSSSNIQSSSNNWYRSFSNNESQRYTPYDQINKENIDELELAWVYEYEQPNYNFVNQFTPVFSDNNLFLTNGLDKIIKLDPFTGKELFIKKLPNRIDRVKGGVLAESRIFLPSATGVIEIDPKNNFNSKTIGNGALTVPPIIDGDTIFIPYLNSKISAVNWRTGEIIWEKSISEKPSNPRIWSGFSYDKISKIIFVVTSNYADLSDYPVIDNLCNSLLAIDALNGNLLWKVQDIEHDLWDLDMVGSPIITKIGSKRYVIAFSKTGNVYKIDITSGEILNKFNKKDIVTGSVYRNSLLTEVIEPKQLGGVFYDYENERKNLNTEKKKILNNILRNTSNFNLSLLDSKSDIVLKGLNGGPSWAGGSYSPKTNILTVTYNNFPWILRSNLKPMEPKKISKLVIKNLTYVNKCILCHSADLSGLQMTTGGLHIPSLIKSKEKYFKIDEFIKIHASVNKKSIQGAPESHYRINTSILKEVDINNLIEFSPKKLFEFSTNINEVTQNDLNDVMLLSKIVNELDDTNFRQVKTWQKILDENNIPVFSEPHGLIEAIDMKNMKTLWRKPFGKYFDPIENKEKSGTPNYGGSMTTKSDIVFATGTSDKKVYAYNLFSGNEIWSFKMRGSGSSSPMSFFIKGCQFILINSGGGWRVNFEKNNQFYAFKIKSCKLNN